MDVTPIVEIVNVIAICDTKQEISLSKISSKTYGSSKTTKSKVRWGYITLPRVKGTVSISRHGKFISVGANSTKNAIKKLYDVKNYLIKSNIINDVNIEPKISNMVAVCDLRLTIDIEHLCMKLPRAVYDPSTYAAMIYKVPNVGTFLVNHSGKIIINGVKSDKKLTNAVFEIRKRLDDYS